MPISRILGESYSSLNVKNFPHFMSHLIDVAYLYFLSCIASGLYCIKSMFQHFIEVIFGKKKSVNGQVILITGSGGYLGRYLAIELAKRNAKLILWDKNESDNTETLKAIKALGFSNAFAETVDLMDEQAVKKAAEAAKKKHGFVSTVILAAGLPCEPKSILKINYEDDIKKQFIIDFMSQLWLIQAFLEPMIAKNQGHFVVISSITALIGLPLVTSFACFKSAQVKLIESLKEELAANDIKNVKTSIVFIGFLSGGLANSFKDIYVFNNGVRITGIHASKIIVNGILKEHNTIYVPQINFLLSVLKLIIPPAFLRLLVKTKVEIYSKVVY